MLPRPCRDGLEDEVRGVRDGMKTVPYRFRADDSIPTLVLSLSKDERFCSWFDKLTTSVVSS